MTRRSAGLLIFRLRPGTGPGARSGEAASSATAKVLDVLLVHPGGPFWARRDDGAWSIPKGEVEEGEDPLVTAEREVREELGRPAAPGPRLPLGHVTQAGGKQVTAWGVQDDVDETAVTSSSFEVEWPPRSGRRQRFPEVDRAAWFSIAQARRKLVPGQVPLLERLQDLVDRTG